MKPATLAFLASTAIVVSVGLWALAHATRISSIEFPSGANHSALRRVRVQVGDRLRFETWSQPANFSYSIWVPFELDDPAGQTMNCRVEAEGWLRPRTLHRDLLAVYCVCERSWLHHDRQVACPLP